MYIYYTCSFALLSLFLLPPLSLPFSPLSPSPLSLSSGGDDDGESGGGGGGGFRGFGGRSNGGGGGGGKNYTNTKMWMG